MRSDDGTTGVPLSKVIFGTGPIGNLKRSLSEGSVDALLDEASRAGLTRFDTSPLYGFGLAELRLGRHLRQLSPHGIKLSTKIGRYFLPSWGEKVDRGNWAAPLNLIPVIDYTRDGVMRSLEQSFVRLGVDRLDTVFVHDIDRRNQGRDFDARYRQVVEQSLPTLQELKAAGHIGEIGVGINEADVASDLLRDAAFDTLMLAGRATLLDHADAMALLHEIARRGMTVQAAAVFNSGILADLEGGGTFDYGQPAEGIRTRAGRVRDVVARFGVPLPAAALQFPLRLPGVASIVVGMSRAEQIGANLEWARWPIADEMWSELEAEGLVVSGNAMRRD